ncbi:MAG: LemA family protein [Bavariicoccus seileri]|uniref:LemA family protein n=1 Tax=Bavariicoccus seileri TaxID=549685 RepID=UPI0003B5EC22|nr:LemA family protein [Bavariicoccus seileri]
MWIWILIGVVAVLVVWGIAIYNNLVKLRQWVKEAWSQIDVQLQRRNDLIPNLVATVKGYAKHEQGTLEKVTEQRNQLVKLQADNASPEVQMELSNQLTNTLKTLFAVSENYPDLKANTNFLNLQEELTNTENKISYARQLYNSSVAKYNIKTETIPSNIIAGIGGFKAEELLKTPEEDRAVPEVSF